MNKTRKILRMLRLVFLISIATLGIGLTGGVPIIPVYKKNDGSELKIELFEPREENTDAPVKEIKL